MPAFTLALLPHSLASWVVDVADRVQCPPDFAAVGIIVAEAAVIGRQIATAFEERDPFLMELTVWPGYDSLRRSAGFEASRVNYSSPDRYSCRMHIQIARITAKVLFAD